MTRILLIYKDHYCKANSWLAFYFTIRICRWKK